ncbi:autotransporter outer membrane beta-barrel domain-containing protein [Pseudomonas graminis]
MDVDLNNKWNIGKLLKAPMCVVPLIFAPCSVGWAAKDAIEVDGMEISLDDKTYSNLTQQTATVLRVINGSTLKSNTMTLTSGGAGGIGASVQDSTFNAGDLIVNVSGDNSTGIRLETGADVVFRNLQIEGTNNAKGLVLEGDPGIKAVIDGGKINTAAGTAIEVIKGGELALNNVAVSTLGSKNYALSVGSSDANAGINNIAVEKGSYSTKGDESSGLLLIGSGSTVTMNEVLISTKGNASMGVEVRKGTATLTNSTIDTIGKGSTALYTESKIRGEKLTVTTKESGAVGMDVRKGEGELFSSTIDTLGDSASALMSYAGTKITADGVHLTTAGIQSYGAWSRDSTLEIRNSDISTTGDKASGIFVARGSSDVLLDTVKIDTQLAQAIELDATQTVMNVKNSELSGGNGQLLTVNHFVNTLDPSKNVYSNVTFNATGSTLNGDIAVSDIGNTVAVDLSSASVLNGAVTQASSLSIDASSEWNMNNVSDVGKLTNNGTITFSDTSKFDTLTVTGDYAGNGGLLVMNTVLGDDSSQTNKLIVGGNVLAGTTKVAINNLGGQGAQTVEGIEVVEVGGTSTGTFEKSGRIVAGAYDYDLVKKAENWYLTSLLAPTDPDPIDPADPNPADPDPGNTRQPSVIRPEAGSYTANLATANTMFLLTLHDRLGETQFIDALTGQQEVTSMWLRQVGGHNSWHDNSGQLKTQSNRYVAQIGGDVARWSTDGLDRWHLGLMAGYGDSHNTTRNQHSGYRSKGSVNGYSVGGYATWYANDENHTGAHLDSWLQYGWFDNEVKGDNLATESYKSHGISASLEGGYTWKLGQFTGSQGSLNEWFIQPQAQAVWMGVKADNVQEANGTKVSGKGDGNLMTRLGVKTYLKGHSAADNNKQREFQPFLQVNWLHNTRNFATQMDDVRVTQNGATNLAEVKVGLEGKVNPRLNLWGNIAVQMGEAGYNDNAAMVGVKYNF